MPQDHTSPLRVLQNSRSLASSPNGFHDCTWLLGTGLRAARGACLDVTGSVLHHICYWLVMRRGLIQPAPGHDVRRFRALAIARPVKPPLYTAQQVTMLPPCQLRYDCRLQRPGFHDLRHRAEQCYSRASSNLDYVIATSVESRRHDSSPLLLLTIFLAIDSQKYFVSVSSYPVLLLSRLLHLSQRRI